MYGNKDGNDDACGKCKVKLGILGVFYRIVRTKYLGDKVSGFLEVKQKKLLGCKSKLACFANSPLPG